MTYQLPREPSAPRLALWRAVRRLGALQVSDGLVALPYSARNLEHLEWLTVGVEEGHGSAAIWLAEAASARAHADYAERMRAAVDEEYRSVLLEAREALAADASGVDGRRTLRRLRGRLRRIASRDYFAAPIGEAARIAVDRLARTAQEVPA